MLIKISKDKELYILHKVSPVNISLSIKHFSTMLASGLAIEDVLKILSDQKLDPMLDKTYAQLMVEIQKGNSLAKSMQAHPHVFSPIVISIIDIGEKGGTLEKNLKYLADYLKKKYELQKKIKNAMIYPVVVLVLTLAEMLGVIFFILPRLQTLFESFENPPATTVAIINFSDFARNNMFPILIGMALLGFIIFRFFKTKIGIRLGDRLALGFPVFKKLNKANILASFSRTLGILLESGLPIIEALQITTNTIKNHFYTEALDEILIAVKNGNTLGATLTKYPQYFPNTFVKMIDVGEKTGSLENNLLYLHEFYTEEVDDISSNLSTLLEPILIIFIGVMIGFLAIIVILPIYQLVGSIGETS